MATSSAQCCLLSVLFMHLSLWLCLHSNKYCLITLILHRRGFADWPKHKLMHKDWLASCIQWVKAAPVGTTRAEAWGSPKLQSNSMKITSCENIFNKNSQENEFQNKIQIIVYLPHTKHPTGNCTLDECSSVWHLLLPQPSYLLINRYKQNYRLHYFCC